MKSIFYNAHHAPTGAFATLTLGQPGPSGGLGLELSGPANEAIHIGVEDHDGSRYQALPFFSYREEQAEDYDVEGLSEFTRGRKVVPFAESEITREFGPCIDTWRAGDLSFRIISPVRSVPDPASGDNDALRDAITPAVYAELTIDNTHGSRARKAYFGYSGTDRSAGMRVLDQNGLVGVAQHTFTGIATDATDTYGGISFQPERILEPDAEENLPFLVGNLGLVVGTVPAGQKRTFRFAIGFFREGQATTGIKTRYLYRRFFDDLESVLRHALAQFPQVVAEAEAFDRQFASQISGDRHWMLAHAIRSYYGSTQLLEDGEGKPIWVVNEGEYRMMNTLDLTVDQSFFELTLNPWTVRNELDLYASRYAYNDPVKALGEAETTVGGLTFTHDMGVANAFSRPGFSGYEQAKLRGCFSYMSAEELMNWVLTASLYASATGDLDWANSHRQTLCDTVTSLANRDHFEDAERKGVVQRDAARCQGGSEITTYDSLDASLGQARNNLYLAVKGWATYTVVADLLGRLGESESQDLALRQAERAVQTILASRDAEGLFPAVIHEGVEARIIPAIEALVYPFVLGLSIPSELEAALKRHLELVLREGVCIFPDGGWRLSSTSRNSWLSKIYLCQYVAEEILGFAPDTTADAAHVGWLLDPDNAYFAWSDQMLAGKAVGSRYYPRGVTAILWLGGKSFPLEEISARLAADGVRA